MSRLRWLLACLAAFVPATSIAQQPKPRAMVKRSNPAATALPMQEARYCDEDCRKFSMPKER